MTIKASSARTMITGCVGAVAFPGNPKKNKEEKKKCYKHRTWLLLKF